MKRIVMSLLIIGLTGAPAHARFDWSLVTDGSAAVKDCMKSRLGDEVWQGFLDRGRPKSKPQGRTMIQVYQACQSGAAPSGGAKKRFGRLTLEEQQAVGLIDTGLRPRFPAGVTCPGVSSPFGSRTRFDGSNRTTRSNNGYHGGMDITLDIGTPLLAAAAGTVIHVGTGGRLVGNVIWMQHAPEDTGFSFWLYTKYQHLDELPSLNVGDRFDAGDVVAVSGDTGTTGGHFGAFGYPHLHMNAYASASNTFKTRDHKVRIDGREYLDPLAVYRSGAADSHRMRSLADTDKATDVGVRLASGEVVPAGARKIWPVHCRRN